MIPPLEPSLPAGLQLQGRCLDELGRAIGQLKGTGDIPERVHEARKSMKRLRAMLRLWQSLLPKRVFRTENACFRDAARDLAEVREAAALAECLTALRAALKDEVRAADWDRVEPLLLPSPGASTELPRHLNSVAEQLELAWRRLEGWGSEDWLTDQEPWETLEAGLKSSYVQGRKGLRLAQRDPCTETLHEWRKTVKYQMYQLDALAPVWPALIDTWRAQLKELSVLLGDDHDLSELEQRVMTRIDDPGLRLRLAGDILRRRQQLRLRAEELGARLYAETPKPLLRRLRQYYESWAAGELTERS